MFTLKNSQTIAAVATTLALAGPGLASAAAVDYFLKIDGIDGESTDARHKGEIEIESWSWGVTQSTSGAGGSRAGKPCTAPMSFSKPVDKATPLLMANAVSGMVIPRAILIGRKAGEGQQDYLKYELKNVMVTSYQTGGSSSSVPVDQFSLNFASLTVEYKPQDPKGGLGSAVSATIQGGC
jgi:type VI secretion system secreted protein Hcp